MSKDALFAIIDDFTSAVKSAESSRMSLDDYLDSGLLHPELRRSISNLLFSYYRHKCAIDDRIDQLCAREPEEPLRRLLRCALTLCFYQTTSSAESAVNAAVEYAKSKHGRGRANFVNAVLRRAVETPREMLDESGFPPALSSRWLRRFSAPELAEFRRLLHTIPPLTFRSVRGELPPETLELLRATPVDAATGFHFYSSAAPQALLGSGLLEAGRIYIQDPAAVMAPQLTQGLNARQILDLCSAPGGKAIALAELHPEARITSLDRSSRRQKLTKLNFTRCQINGEIRVHDAREPLPGGQKFDLILADVPCSNTGVFRRRPDALYSFSAAKIDELKALQYAVAEAGLKSLSPGGALVYSTCSIEPEENHDVVQSLLSGHPDLTLKKETLLLPDAGHDGAYAALIFKAR